MNKKEIKVEIKKFESQQNNVEAEFQKIYEIFKSDDFAIENLTFDMFYDKLLFFSKLIDDDKEVLVDYFVERDRTDPIKVGKLIKLIESENGIKFS
mgnify:CR=1 FL=1